MIRFKFILSILLMFSSLFSQAVTEIKFPGILRAMETQRGYNVTATTNVARFQAMVLLKIAKTLHNRDSTAEIIFLDNREWYRAFKHYTQLSDREMPTFSRLAIDYQQDQVIDLRQSRIIKKNKTGPKPEFAINVIVGWDKNKIGSSYYTFNDTLSQPGLKVKNQSQITYRILEFDDFILYDDMRGISGQPTSGILGIIFRLIGEGQVMWSKFTITPTGLQINRARAKKGIFEIESTLTIYPDGNTLKNLPDDQPELKPYETLLTRPTSIEYFPIEPSVIRLICGF